MTHPVQQPAQHLVTLDAKYPDARWFVRVGEDGDFAGPCDTPAETLAQLCTDWNTSLDKVIEDYDGQITVGMWTEDAIYLRHLDALVQAGVPEAKARELVAELKRTQSEALEAVNAEEAWFGWTPVYDVQDDGTLTLAVTL